MSWDEIKLNNHIADIEKDEAREAAVAELSEKIASKLKRESFYQPSGDMKQGCLDASKTYWNMDDFIADVCIGTAAMISMIGGDSSLMQKDMESKFYEYCLDIAEKCIDKEGV